MKLVFYLFIFIIVLFIPKKETITAGLFRRDVLSYAHIIAPKRLEV